jgi:hypothetical protein
MTRKCLLYPVILYITTPVFNLCAAGVWGKVETKWEKIEEYKKSSKCIMNIIFKNNTMIRILAIELVNTILLQILCFSALSIILFL